MPDTFRSHPINTNVVETVAIEMDVDVEKLHSVLEDVQTAIFNDVNLLRNHSSTSLILETPTYTQMLCGVEEWNVIDDRTINDDTYREAAASCHAREAQNIAVDERLDKLLEKLTAHDVLVVTVSEGETNEDMYSYNNWSINFDFTAETIDSFSANVSGTFESHSNKKYNTETTYQFDEHENVVTSSTTITDSDGNKMKTPQRTIDLETISDNPNINEVSAWVRTDQQSIGEQINVLISENAITCNDCGTQHNPNKDNYVTDYPLPSGEERQLCNTCYAEIVADETYFSNRESEVLALMYHNIDYVSIGEMFGKTKGCIAAFKHRMGGKISKKDRTDNVINSDMRKKLNK